MSFATYADAVQDWVTATYGTSFNVTWSGTKAVKVKFGNQKIQSNDTPCVRFVYSHSTSFEGSTAFTEGFGAMVCQIFTSSGIGPKLADTIAGQIESDTKRTSLSAVKLQFGAAHPMGSGSEEPTGLYQLTLRVPIWYLEAA